MLTNTLVTQLVLQITQRRTLLCNHHQSRCIPIKPMHELQKPGLRPRRPQDFDQPEIQPATTVNRYTGWLINHQHLIIFKHHRVLHDPLNPGAWNYLRRLFLSGNRWNAHLITRIQTGVGLHPALVHAHLALADNPIDDTARYIPDLRHQVVVHALTVVILINHHLSHTLPDFATSGAGHRATLFATDRLR